MNKVRERIAAGAPITELDEEAFLDLVRRDRLINPTGELDFAGLLGQLHGHVDGGKLGRALDMLRSDRFQLYARLDAERLVGVVRSQSGAGSVYASWLGVTGHYGCTQPDLSDCKGLQGSACKHLLVLVLGLARAGQLPMAQALQWLRPPTASDRGGTRSCARIL